jgi:hypothetical protein
MEKQTLQNHTRIFKIHLTEIQVLFSYVKEHVACAMLNKKCTW